jgi:hypothetical protein
MRPRIAIQEAVAGTLPQAHGKRDIVLSPKFPRALFWIKN